jgi:hypothetical protein
MNRKQLEVRLAYAEREREQLTGFKATFAQWLMDQGYSPVDTVPPVKRITSRPDWMADGSTVTPNGGGSQPYTLDIGGEIVCLVHPNDGSGKDPFPVETSRLMDQWRPYIPSAHDDFRPSAGLGSH